MAPLPRVDLRRADRRGSATRPPGLTQIEIMKDHQWFSGRTIGLPFIPTVGACTGKVVALASPRATNKPFNWARVLKHEVVHVITLAADRVQHPPLVHRGPGRRERGVPPARRSGTRCSWSACRPREAAEPRHDQPRLHPPQGARRPPDGLLPGAALRPVHAQAVRRRRPDQDARRLPPRPDHRPGRSTTASTSRRPTSRQGISTYLDEVVKTIRTRVDDEKPVKFSQLERSSRRSPTTPT